MKRRQRCGPRKRSARASQTVETGRRSRLIVERAGRGETRSVRIACVKLTSSARARARGRKRYGST
eukprot:6190958-Pleurochrysis_carterae.AAC.3